MTVASRPADGDQAITLPTGTNVFLEPEVGRYLADKVLDVREDVDGRFHAVMNGDSITIDVVDYQPHDRMFWMDIHPVT
ncbi:MULTISPECIES: hypothetical protein [Saccharothrix]|uniref:hypothetical protein n=1 Tax=Saccharothrix TaxID=2071 RepID=UPI00093B9084|nr:hypothetical protein [Saccharothrix sp. CB00851]OKI32009.1 hypothetical protein A6A25_26565 [Saccharothrix sp. CB00851]